jgi:Lon protease-like protein
MQIDSIQDASEQEIPLFPLNVVLFPGGILPLHIFEPRYQLMTESCLDNESVFGVVLIKEGEEVGDAAKPHLVGTAAKIIEVNRFEDGRMNLLTAGQYRFEITALQHEQPYLVGRVSVPRLAKTENDEEMHRIVSESGELYQSYESLMDKLIFAWNAPETIPTLPHHLAYQIGTRLQIPLDEKQQLLETFPIDELLKQEIALLKREIRILKFRLSARNN